LRPKSIDIAVLGVNPRREGYTDKWITASLLLRTTIMKIEIHNEFFEEREFFRFVLYDGPDGIEKVSGLAIDLPEVFAKIMEWRYRIAQDYCGEIIEENQTD
jgi:hypothetical protein